MLKRLSFSVLLLLALLAPVGSQGRVIQDLGAPDLKKMMDEKSITLVNVLSEIEYKIQHIEGSINIPIIYMENSTKLPAGKNHPLAFYCLSER